MMTAVKRSRTQSVTYGTVVDEDGYERLLPQSAARWLEEIISPYRYEGMLSFWDSYILLQRLEKDGSVGDIFSVYREGRRPITFVVSSMGEGLSYSS